MKTHVIQTIKHYKNIAVFRHMEMLKLQVLNILFVQMVVAMVPVYSQSVEMVFENDLNNVMMVIQTKRMDVQRYAKRAQIYVFLCQMLRGAN